MKHSLYYKFILGYLVFGLLGFASIATLSAQLMNKNQVKNQAEAMYDEANLIASAYSSVYQSEWRKAALPWNRRHRVLTKKVSATFAIALPPDP